MTTSALEIAVPQPPADFWKIAEPHEGRIAIAALLALAAHAGFGLWAPSHTPARPPAPPPVEVEIALREPPPPPPPEPVAAPEPEPAPAPVRAAAPKAA